MSRSIEQALEVLGVAADSGPEAVAHAYRRLARATHPDVSEDPEAAERFATLAAAYRMVADRSRSRGPVGRSATAFDRPPPRMVLLGEPSSGTARPWPGTIIVAGPVLVRVPRPGPGTDPARGDR